MAIKVSEPDLVRYVSDVAKNRGNLGKSAALRLIIAEHREASASHRRYEEHGTPAAPQPQPTATA